MLFRATYVLSLLVFVLNVGAILPISGVNAVEKTFFLIAAFSMIFTRKMDGYILVLLFIQLVLVTFLATMTEYPQFSWGIFFASLNQIIVFFVLLAGKPNHRDKYVILTAMAILPIICVVFGILYQLAGIKSSFAAEFVTGLQRYVGSLSAAAFTSALAMCGVFAAVQLMLAKNNKYIVVIIINLVVLLAAGGRAALAVAIVVSGASVLLHRGTNFSTRLYFILSGLVAGLAVLSFFWSSLMTRFLESGDNGRLLMWEYIRSLAAQYPYAGIGFGHQFFTTPREIAIMTGSPSAHNDYLRLTLELGSPGMIIFYIILTLAVLRASFRDNQRNYLVVIAYLGFLFLSNSDNALSSPVEFPLMFLAILSGPEVLKRGRARLDPQRKHIGSASNMRRRNFPIV